MPELPKKRARIGPALAAADNAGSTGQPAATDEETARARVSDNQSGRHRHDRCSHPRKNPFYAARLFIEIRSNPFSLRLPRSGYLPLTVFRLYPSRLFPPSPVSFHSLRHAAVTLRKEAGAPVVTVMEPVDHDSKQMSEHYTHVGRESMIRAAESFPDL